MEEKDYLSLLLPSGMEYYFKLTSVKKLKDSYELYLEELNEVPPEYSGEKLLSKGFYEEVSIQDFPLRGRKCFLKVKRRRWEIESSGKIVSRNWEVVANGTRLTQELADFLKAINRYPTHKL